MKTKYNFILIVLCFVMVDFTFGQTNRLVHFQGQLKTSDGQPFEGEVTLTFNFYKTLRSTTPFWSETHENVPVKNGEYEVLLGSQNPLRLSYKKYFLEVKAEGLDTGFVRTPISGPGYNWRLSYLFAAYTIVWMAIFLYLLSITRRQKRIINELEILTTASNKEPVEK